MILHIWVKWIIKSRTESNRMGGGEVDQQFDVFSIFAQSFYKQQREGWCWCLTLTGL